MAARAGSPSSRLRPVPPGAYRPPVDRWGPFPELFASLEGPVMVVADARVLSLHPAAARALTRADVVVALRAGESAKSLRTVERLGQAGARLPRGGTVVALGGGTIGDVTTVVAHLLKRGVALVQVPTTWLAAVDSSLGGKGAVNVGGIKNALGCFHAPVEGWLCPELFTTLSKAQRREGEAEAWKMAVTLSERTYRAWCARPPALDDMVRESRALKTRVCTADPYEQLGLRVGLNFGHTVGHVIESVTGYRVRHGVAVALGMVAALDVGRAVGVTPPRVASAVEASLPWSSTARGALARALSAASWEAAFGSMQSDKKGASRAGVTFVLLEAVGRWRTHVVAPATLRALWATWRRG